jgi:hypothetical protein
VNGQLLAHMAGDYVVQSDWMAQTKTSSHLPAAAHALSYAACFLPLTRDPKRLAFIAASHFVIDRWRLARHVVYAKNQLVPRSWRYPWTEAKRTGYPDEREPWMTVWLLILADNTMHGICNALALRETS